MQAYCGNIFFGVIKLCKELQMSFSKILQTTYMFAIQYCKRLTPQNSKSQINRILSF